MTASALAADLPDGAEAGWCLTVPEDGAQSHVIHLRMPDSEKKYTLYVDTGDGWEVSEATQDGSYLIFSAAGTSFRAALAEKKSELPLILVCAGAAAVVALGAALVLHKKKKRKKTAAKAAK